MSKNPTSDRDDGLMAGLRRRDPAVIDAWFRTEHPRFYRLSFGLLGDHQDAEDLASEALIKVLDRLDSTVPTSSFRAWSYALVTNLCRDRLRNRKSRPATTTAEADLFPGALPSAPGRLEQSELRELITRCLARLSEREREVFVLRELEARPTDEVALTLEITEGTVRSLLTLARRRMRGLLERGLADPNGERT